MLPSSPIVSRQPTIASRRQRMNSEKLSFSLSINTNVSYQDFTKARGFQQTAKINDAFCRHNTLSHQPQQHQQLLRRVSTTTMSNSSESLSNEELSSRIADSFQQFSSILTQLSSSTFPKGGNNNNNCGAASESELIANTGIPVTPSHINQNSSSDAKISMGSKLSQVKEMLVSLSTENQHQPQNEQTQRKNAKAIMTNNRPQMNMEGYDEHARLKEFNEVYAVYDHKIFNANIRNPKLRCKLIARWFNRAAAMGDMQTMQHMLEHVEVNVNLSDDKDSGITPLMYTSYFGHNKCIELLLKQPNIRINKQDKKGWTALTWGVIGYRTLSVKMLLGNGAEIPAMSKIVENLSNSLAAKNPIIPVAVVINNDTALLPAKFSTTLFPTNQNQYMLLHYHRESNCNYTNEQTICEEYNQHRSSTSDFNQMNDIVNTKQRKEEITGGHQIENIQKEDEDVFKDWTKQILTSCTFDWHRCLYSQMFVYNVMDMHVIIDMALQVSNVKALKDQVSSSNELWRPANVLFLSSRYACYYSSKESLSNILEAYLNKQAKVIKTASHNAEVLAFWMANMCQLLRYFKKDIGLSLTTHKFQTKLTELVWIAYTYFVSESTKELGKVLDSCLIDFESLPELGTVEFADDWQRFFKRSSRSSLDSKRTEVSPRVAVNYINVNSFKAGNSTLDFSKTPTTPLLSPQRHSITSITSLENTQTNSPHTISQSLVTAQSTLQSYHVPPAIIVQCMSQLVRYVSFEVIQRILSQKKRKCLCRTKALQICINIHSLEEWLSLNQFPPSMICKHFQPLKQILQLLQCISQIDDVFAFTSAMERFDKVSPTQMKYCIQNYRYEVTEARLPVEIEQLVSQITTEYEQREQDIKNSADRGSNAPQLWSSNLKQLDLLIAPVSVKTDHLITIIPTEQLSEESNNTYITNMSFPKEMESDYILPFSATEVNDLLSCWKSQQRKNLQKTVEINNYADAIYKAIKVEKQDHEDLFDKIYPCIPEDWLFQLDKRLGIQ
ncbi:hypothetical protein BDF20DRAFT_914999 [Mycotypha africana]|uniref:uncharacterized protein n=1 Tax=Mycotypha africana TaxID=64632 RepID=UPI002300926F|nr:uncharacterized protein BDF20DRAFT_914999 [Mycotypha africana]KAI8973575.1 hypothetical protein BDF20DRAFT_914999 [Mycotypha africana]